MRKPLFRLLKRGGHRKNWLILLERDNVAGRETLSVATALDLINNRVLGIAGPQEVGMKRMTGARVDGALRSHKRLTKDLTAIDALPAGLWTCAFENIAAFGFNIQQSNQFGYSSAAFR
jgi:hypothetical protein